MDENIKAMLVLAPIVLPVAYGMLRTFVTEPEFRKGIYTILVCGAGFFGWIMFLKHIVP